MKTVLSLVSAGVLILSAQKNEWKSVSEQEQSIQYRWSRPANNSCEVSFRDLRLIKKTEFNARYQYLPHKMLRKDVQTQTAHLIIRTEDSAAQHISDCEEILSVTVLSVMRQ